MLGDVLDWDTGLVLLHLIARTMGLRGSKGGQSSQKSESAQKKGGLHPSEVGTSPPSPPPPLPKEVSSSSCGTKASPAVLVVAPAPSLLSTSTPHCVSQATLGGTESEEGKRVSEIIQEDIINQKTDAENNFAGQDTSPSSEVNSNSCTNTDTTSLTEDISFASCLADPSTNLLEDRKVEFDSVTQLPIELEQTTHTALSSGRTDDTQINSDSEYESAPETDIEDQSQSQQKEVLNTEANEREEVTGQQKEQKLERKEIEESFRSHPEDSPEVRESTDGEEAPKESKEVIQQSEQNFSDQTAPSKHFVEKLETSPHQIHEHLVSTEKCVRENKEIFAHTELLQHISTVTHSKELIDGVKSESSSRDDRSECELASGSITVPKSFTECISFSTSSCDHTPVASTSLVLQTEESEAETTVSPFLASVDRNNKSLLKDTVPNECKQIVETKEPVLYFSEYKSCPGEISVSEKESLNEERIIVPPKGYDLSFLEQLDDSNFDPFITKTAIRNSPPPSPQRRVKLSPLKPAIKKKGFQASKGGPDVSEYIAERPDTTGGPGEDLDRTVEKLSESFSEESGKASCLDQHQKEALINREVENSGTSHLPTQNNISDNSIHSEGDVLEIAFGDSKPEKSPPKLLERKPISKAKKPVKKQVKKTTVETNNNCIHSKGENLSEKQEEDVPLPQSKGYNLDFLDSIDDNFNPFETKATVSNSPPKDGFTLSADELKEFRSKARIISPKKTHLKKGFDTFVESSKDANQTAVNGQEIDFKELSSDRENSCPDSGSVPEVVQPTKELEEAPVNAEKDISKESQVLVGVTKEKVQYFELSDDIPKSLVFNKEPEHLVVKILNDQLSEQEEKIPVNTNKGYDLDFLDDPNIDTFKSKPDFNNKIQPDSDVKKKDKAIDITDSGSNVSEFEITKENTKSVGVTDSSQLDKQVNASVSVEEEETGVIDKEEAQEAKDSLSDLAPSIPEVLRNQGQEVKSPLSENGYSDKSLLESSIPKVPSVNKIGRLDSSEFAELLGNEASRLVEELMNCSFDSGLHDSNESFATNNSLISSMADSENNRSSVHLDENVNPFKSKSSLARTPPTKHRQLGNGGNDTEIDPFKPRRTLKREEVPGMEERVDTPSMDEDSGIIVGSRSDLMLEADVNHSEAGPEVAMGLTPSDLKCASQFFKEASCLETQLRKSLVTPLGSQTKLSGDEGTSTKDDTPPSLPSPQHKTSPPPERRSPPREERSAPEGTSSPTPRSNESAEHKNNNNTGQGKSSVPSGYMSSAQVEELLKQQELQFEEKLLRVELSAGEKEKQLRHSMKSEQKQLAELQGNVDELTQSRDALLKMVGQYKSMLSSLVAEREKENATRDEKLRAVELERNQALQDLANVEAAFSDVHRKYERTKQVVDTLRRNEETLRGAVADYESKLQKQEQKMVELQKHAEERIQKASEEYEQMRRSSEQEITKMSALLKKAEMKIISLQEGVDRKARENQELTQLCDDLINKMGSGK